MKISKHIHSCLLIEDQGKTILVDPGLYTVDEHAIPIDQLSQLYAICYTHDHFDHFNLPFLKQLLIKFPQVQIFSNTSVINVLQKENIIATEIKSGIIESQLVPHERVFDKKPPLNTMFNIAHKLTHPGDSISFKESKEVLALPLLGPSWMITQAVEKAMEIKPKVIIPIHDYHWKDDIRKNMYDRLEEFFAKNGIIFLKAETGMVFEL